MNEAGRRRELLIVGAVAGFFLCCYVRVLTTGYLELDDLGRVQVGYNLWSADGRLLTAGLMALLSFDGRMLDISPLPQLGAIALMGLSGVLLSRAAPELGATRIAAAAILLFATPFYLQNMTYVFDSLSMTAAVVLALWSALLVERRPAAAVAALLAALLFYQPAVNVFLCFAAAAVLFRLARRDRSARQVAIHAVLAVLAAAALDGLLIAVLRVTRLVVLPDYQAQHAALMRPHELFRLLPRNAHDLLALASRMAPPTSPFGLLAVLAILGCLAVSLQRAGVRAWPLSLLAVVALLSGFAGPMLLLRDPVVQPRVLVGIGAMLSASAWTAMRLLPHGRSGQAVVAVALLLAACFARDSFAYGALLRDLDRYEASVLPPVAAAVNAEHVRTGLGPLQMLGAMPFPPTLRHGLDRAPALAPLFDNPLNGISWFGLALLAQYGLEDGIWFRDAGPAAVLCRSYRDTGSGYSVGSDSGSLVLIFRGGCPVSRR